MDFGIIGGTGLSQLTDEQCDRAMHVDTRYGVVHVDRVPFGGAEVAFVARHGTAHTIPPHRVNYRANISALREIGVRNILASAAVGSMADALPPGALAILTQFIDFTRGRESTFHDGDGGEVVHVDMTEPYCPHLRGELEEAAHAVGEQVRTECAYVCAEGPRFETPAEIHMFAQLGGDVVGMTNVPEVTLAREAGICYAAVAVVTNWAAGMSKDPVRHTDVDRFMAEQVPRLSALFARVVEAHRDVECSCRLGAAR